MSNDITGRYFRHHTTYEEAMQLFRELAARLHFTSSEEIFRGRIHSTDKISSIIHKGQLDGKNCILKLQILNLPQDEVAIIDAFNRENRSTKLRLPTVLSSQAWNQESGYGYLLMEEVVGHKMYTPPFATNAEMDTFLAMYQEYKTHSIPKNLCTPEVNETRSTVFSTKRLTHWCQIADDKKSLSNLGMDMLEQFLLIAPPILQTMPMEMQHGHLSMDDIRVTNTGEFVLMSNLFWSYRPQYYDTSFHLWAGIKAIKDTTVTSKEVLAYIEQWVTGYEALPVIAADPDFRRKFAVMMAERSIAAVILDIYSQDYSDHREEHIEHLTDIFTDIFDWCCLEIKK